MRTAWATAVLLLCMTSAIAAAPFDGKWGHDQATCDADEGDTVTVANGQITYYESQCDIGPINPIGDSNSAWRAELTCSGEGETWVDDTIFAIDRGNGEEVLQLIEINMTDGSVVARKPCH